MRKFPDYLQSSQESIHVPEKKPLSFLNYKPKNPSLLVTPPVPNSAIKTIEDRFSNNLATTIDSFFNDTRKELNIIPKKSNIDLKRSLMPKWEKLDKRTEVAIIELLKRKIEGEDKHPKSKESKKALDKGMEFTGEEKKFRPMFDADIVYDNEMYDKIGEQNEPIEDEPAIQTEGSNLVSALNMQATYFDAISQDFED